MRRFLRSAMITQAFDLVEAPTARDGLAQAAGRRPDGILLDLGLPAGDGVAVTPQATTGTRMRSASLASIRLAISSSKSTISRSAPWPTRKA